MSGLPPKFESRQIDKLMTQQMEEDIREQRSAGIQDEIQRAQRRAILAQQESKAKDRLKRSLSKRATNRRRNKAARKARRKQR